MSRAIFSGIQDTLEGDKVVIGMAHFGIAERVILPKGSSTWWTSLVEAKMKPAPFLGDNSAGPVIPIGHALAAGVPIGDMRLRGGEPSKWPAVWSSWLVGG